MIPARLRWLWAPLTLAVGAILLVAPMLAEPGAVGATDDWRWFHLHWEASRAAVVLHGELPAWNPYHCGGHVHWANPQTQFLSPAWWPTLAIGAPLGLQLFTLLHLAAGLLSMAWLATEHGLSGAARVTACAVWALSGFFAWHVGGGHVAFQPLWYAPAALAAFHRSLADSRWIAALAGVLALMVLEGGVYPVPFTVVLLGVHATYRCLNADRWTRPLTSVAVAGGVAALAAGIKLVPILSFLRSHPRVTQLEDKVGLAELLTMFVSRSQAPRFGDHVFVWPEYASYVGVAVLVAVAGLLLLRGFRRHCIWWIGLVVSASLTLGDHGGLSPWAVLHSLPVFDALRVPSRFAVLVTLHMAMLAGFALDEAQTAIDQHAWRRTAGGVVRALPVLFALGVTADLATLGQRQFDRFVAPTAPADPATDAAFRMTTTPWRQAWALPGRKEGTIACYEPHRLPRGKVAPGPTHFTYAGGTDTTGVRATAWRPSRVEISGALERKGMVLLNQNDHPGWVLEGDGERTERRGVPTAELPAGPFRVAFVYRIPGLGLGLLATLAGLALLVVLGRTTDERWALTRVSLARRLLHRKR